jgi:hypothetical protein
MLEVLCHVKSKKKYLSETNAIWIDILVYTLFQQSPESYTIIHHTVYPILAHHSRRTNGRIDFTFVAEHE